LKRVLAAVVAAGVLVVGAAPASAATPLSRQVSTLQKQVRTLQRQVRTLRTQARNANEGATAALAFAVCGVAITGDAFQNTWTVINQVANRTIFGAPQTLDDQGACNALRVTRQPTQVPPTIAPFSALLALLGGRVATPFAMPWWTWGH
jgi:outer membrane murein-binding lipoprotein Lpp